MSEWTMEELDGCALLNRHDGSVPMQFTYVSGIKEITKAHNASLSAEREKHNKELREYESALSDTHLSRIKVLEHQLAAEREKYDALTGSSDEVITIDEEGKIKPPKPTIRITPKPTGEWTEDSVNRMFPRGGAKQITDAHNAALAAEREKVTLATQMVQIESKRANEAERKVQTLVDALKLMPEIAYKSIIEGAGVTVENLPNELQCVCEASLAKGGK